VTGPFHDDGASAVARNLAVALGLAQLRVLLVDADLRNGRLANLGPLGLSDVLTGKVDVEHVIRPWGDGTIHVLPAGPTPANPSELLGSPAMTELMAKLEEEYELILVYAPSVLRVADAAVLATKAHAVLLTVRIGRTRRDAVRRSVQVLDDVNARVLGAVALERQALGARLGTLRRTWARAHRPLVPPDPDPEGTGTDG
jgi:capsular exopolysaccharide synthesis family protein